MAITLSEDSSIDNIYTGFWVNQAYGPFRGACLTLSQEAGGLLIAFLALFVTAASSSIWKITRFMLHTTYATPKVHLQDGLHQQRQILLRNTALPINTALSMLWASKVWRNRAANARRRTIPVAALALAVSAIFAAAGVFSSKLLTKPASEVLIASPDCGPLQRGNASGMHNVIALAPHLSRVVLESSTYAAQCYGQTKGACDTFISQSLPYQVDKHASCPFHEKICKLANDNLLLDTVAIDSVEHLGLNDGPRFTVHHKMHCAPLKTENYTKVIPSKDTSSSSLVEYYYGPIDGQDTTFTMEVPTHRRYGASNEYIITTQKFQSNSSDIISELYQPHADVSLHLLDGFGISYLNRTEDPWFSATTCPSDRIGGASDKKNGQPEFLSDIPGAVVGCASQIYFCNPDLPAAFGCVDLYRQLLGADQKTESDVLPSIWPDEKDQTMIRPILSFLSTGTSAGALSSMPTKPSLLARQSLLSYTQMAALPVDQWQIEQENYFNTSLALMQFMTLDFAKGTWWGEGRFCGPEDNCQRGCHSQKVKSSRYYSFSAWSLGAVLIGGGLLMLIGTFLEDIISLVLKVPGLSSTKLAYAHSAWLAESTLQLHRLAHENLGLGSWKRTDEAIPVTHSDVALAVLDVTDPKHVRMMVPTEELEYLSPAQNDANVRARVKYERVPSSAQL